MRGNFRIQLGHDETSPPTKSPFGSQNIRKHVVSNIEQSVSTPQSQQSVQSLCMAPLEHFALGEEGRHGLLGGQVVLDVGQVACCGLRVDAEQRQGTVAEQ